MNFLEDCKTRGNIFLHARTQLTLGRPSIDGVHALRVRAVTKEIGEMPSLSHVGARNPGRAASACTRQDTRGARGIRPG